MKHWLQTMLRNRSKDHNQRIEQLVTLARPNSAEAEAYRVVRTNLHFMGLDQPVKSILITSAAPGEGKSVTTANLAIACAQSGARVLAVDADLRRPRLGSLLSVSSRRGGLTSMLVGASSLEDSVQPGPVSGMSILASGPLPPNPAELLGSKRMAEFLESAVEAYDFVLVDTPPVLGLTDAVVLAPHCDGVLMVVRAGRTAYPLVKRAQDGLTGVRARILGVVLSGVSAENETYYYG